MNLDRLYEILKDTTKQLRKGAEIEERQAGPIEVIEVYNMPHESEASGLEKVDVHFVMIGVDKAKAETHRDNLIEILREYPFLERLAAGPSYIEVGAEIGDQGAAFQLFALGQVLGLWQVITPETLGFSGEQAQQMAGRGYIMISGYKEEA